MDATCLAKCDVKKSLKKILCVTNSLLIKILHFDFHIKVSLVFLKRRNEFSVMNIYIHFFLAKCINISLCIIMRYYNAIMGNRLRDINACAYSSTYINDRALISRFSSSCRKRKSTRRRTRYINAVHSYVRTCGRSSLSDCSLCRADQKSFLESYATVITMKFY